MFRSNRYATVAATLALLFSLAGTATATSIRLITGNEVKDGSLSGADLANNSVDAKKLKAHTVDAGDLRPGSLTSREIRNGTLSLGDLSTDALGALKGAQGAQGDQGTPGPQGADGSAGSRGPVGLQGADGTGIKLAGHVKTDPQTLPGDSTFHAAWSISFSARSDQIFILTGNIGNAQANPCMDLMEQATVDGVPAPSVFNGGFLTFPAGTHTLAYEVSASCPIDVPNQEAIVIPFTLP